MRKDICLANTAQFALGVKGTSCHFMCMSGWTTSLPDADRPVWQGRNFAWFAAASFAALRALVAARWQLRRLLPRDIDQANKRAATHGRAPAQMCPGDLKFIAQLQRVIPRIAKVCPFRSDCLVQALAGQRLLLKRKITGRVVLAAERGEPGLFQPHALLMAGNVSVTGGDPSLYTSLLGELDADIRK